RPPRTAAISPACAAASAGVAEESPRTAVPAQPRARQMTSGDLSGGRLSQAPHTPLIRAKRSTPYSRKAPFLSHFLAAVAVGEPGWLIPPPAAANLASSVPGWGLSAVSPGSLRARIGRTWSAQPSGECHN